MTSERIDRWAVEAEPMRERIEAMFNLDRAMAYGTVVCMWLAVGVVFLGALQWSESDAVRIALGVAALAVLVFNTASIIAMVQHYAHDKEFIYGIDLRHLDELRADRD